MGVTNKSADFKAKFPLGKVPAFESDAGNLFESNAIAYYVCAAHKPELLGATPYESALVQQFINFSETEIQPKVSGWLYPLMGYAPMNEAIMAQSKEDLLKVLAIFDKILLPKTFLVGNRITLADIIVACTLWSSMSKLIEPEDRKSLVNLVRWYVTCVNQPEFKSVLGAVGLCVKTMEPIKPAAPAVASSVPKEEEEEAMPVQTGFNFENWKRFYSNNPTRPTAMNYFWEHYEPENYSSWRVSYKYSDELKMIFMTCNLITGLYNRMDHIRKNAFGVLSVFGESNNNQIEGVFVFKGTDIPPEMIDVPDYESYTFTRLDFSKQADKDIFEDFLADEGKFEGIPRPFNQSKVFK